MIVFCWLGGVLFYERIDFRDIFICFLDIVIGLFFGVDVEYIKLIEIIVDDKDG